MRLLRLGAPPLPRVFSARRFSGAVLSSGTDNLGPLLSFHLGARDIQRCSSLALLSNFPFGRHPACSITLAFSPLHPISLD